MLCKFCEEKTEEELIQCNKCKGFCHPSCLELPANIVPQVKEYAWECNDCKCCFECQDIENEEQILFCDRCDRGYHMYCCKPRRKRKPKGDWFCTICVEASKNKNVPAADLPNLLEVKDKCSDMDNENKLKSDNLEQVTPEKTSHVEKTGSNDRKTCLLSKKYSPNKTCPFPGCDGLGNTKPNNSVHFSVNHCPMSRNERKRERELLSMTTDEELPPKIAIKNPNLEEPKENNSDNFKNSFSLTPIKNIVSKTDLELFEAAQKNSQDRLELDIEMAPKADGLRSVVFGDTEMDIWYRSQYPVEFSKQATIYVCEFCLAYSKTETIYIRHMAKCKMRHPPGEEIYRKQNLSFFEVDGQNATPYCQNLCLFAKLFLDHKTLWLDVAPFLFYVLTHNNDKGCHIIGYFSKEKVSFLNYNLSCILVMPNYMKKGYGKMLIDFSYLLSQVEGKTGSPERPLSDLGLISYRKFWTDKLLKYLMNFDETQISIKGISEKLAIHTNDIISTLQFLGMLKYWKGKHLILLKKEVIEEYAEKVKERPQDFLEIDSKFLEWIPKVYT